MQYILIAGIVGLRALPDWTTEPVSAFALHRIHAPAGQPSLRRHDARLRYRLTRPLADGRARPSLTPIELLERLARLLPPPRAHRHRCYGVGATPVLPAPKDASACISKSLARDWWNRAVQPAGLEPKKGRGWHSLSRKFTSELVRMPLKVLCELGGWNKERTVFQSYQHADKE